jgi:hypothetical protein
VPPHLLLRLLPFQLKQSLGSLWEESSASSSSSPSRGFLSDTGANEECHLCKITSLNATTSCIALETLRPSTRVKSPPSLSLPSVYHPQCRSPCLIQDLQASPQFIPCQALSSSDTHGVIGALAPAQVSRPSVPPLHFSMTPQRKLPTLRRTQPPAPAFSTWLPGLTIRRVELWRKNRICAINGTCSMPSRD